MDLTAISEIQQGKYKIFYDLHHAEEPLVLPNIWDPLGALLLERMGFPAVATASASVAFSNGYDDGEQIPFPDLLHLLKRITASVNIPVSADIESGFAAGTKMLKENIRKLVGSGIVGINLEDSDKSTNELYPIDEQCARINAVREVCLETGMPLFINARTDIYLRDKGFDTPESRLEEARRRGTAYQSAGADCFFPIVLKDGHDIPALINAIDIPVNISLLPGGPSLSELSSMKVARVSMGPSLLRITIKAMQEIALKLQRQEGDAEITGNEITTAYLRELVNKKDQRASGSGIER